MKNLKMFAIGLAAMTAMTMGVHAATSTTYKDDNISNFVSCLTATTDTASCTLTKSGEITTAVHVTKDVTLNLADGVVLTLKGNAITINDGGSLTVNGGEIVRDDTTSAKVFDVKAGASLTTKAVKLSATATAPNYIAKSVIGVVGDNGTTKITRVNIGKDTTVTGYAGLVVFPDGFVRGTAAQANNVIVDLNGTWNTTDYTIQVQGDIENSVKVPVINFNGGTYNSEKEVAIYLAGDNKTTIAEGVTVEGAEAILVKSGTLTVNGGTFTATAATCTGTTANDHHAQAYGAALAVVNQSGYEGNADVTVNGGKFTSTNCRAVNIAKASSAGSTTFKVALKGGEFVAEKGEAVIDSYIASVVSGGTYIGTFPTGSYLANNLSQKTVNGVTYVGKEYNVTTKVEEENGKVDSINTPSTALSGTEVTIADYVKVTANEGFTAVYKVTDAEGNEITVTDGKFTMPESDVTITVTFVEKTAAVTPGDNTGSGDTEQEPPKTGDNIMAFVGLGIASLAVVGLGTKNLKKQTN